jgi:mitochondrial enoyl-[acyl-carrier protein] reductase / trans-2-enoyl-CoA reductase
MEKASAIVISEHGEPAKVASLASVELPPPGPGEVRVRVLLAPINPADINVLEGKYPVRPELPGVPGVEGVGVVEDSAHYFEKGTRVLLPHCFGSWRAAGNASAAELVVVPDDIPLEQASMLRINPATALCMLRDFLYLCPNDWVLQNAANSAVGRCVIRMCRHFGWRTFNIVRREELIAELLGEGADAVIVEGGEIPKNHARLALNAVGGDSATRLSQGLSEGGAVVTYGAMGRQPLKIPNGPLIFSDIAWRGFWVTRWYRDALPSVRDALFAELFELVRAGVVATPVEKVYPLGEISDALKHAQQPMRSGKVLLRCSE